MKKRILSIFTAVCVIVSCCVISMSVSASTIHELKLNEMKTTITDENKESWYTYTPVVSGTYSFLSYNKYRTEGRLFLKEINPDTGKEEFKQIVFAQGDKNYQENEHNILQFCLTYELEKGTTYYFSAKWYDPNTPVQTMNVKLRCDSYSTSVIDHIELNCPATLSSYQNGIWNKDSVTGEMYFYYNINRIKTNMQITVYFTNGDVQKVTGADSIGEYDINYNHTQSENHWYPKESSKYTGNTLTVSILDVSADFEVPIDLGAYAVAGRVVDFNGEPVKNAKINAGGVVYKTDLNGAFAYSAYGDHEILVYTDNALERKVHVVLGAKADVNDFSASPVEIVSCDYVHDGVINAKDYSFITKKLTGEELDKQQMQFEKVINFSEQDYNTLVLK